MNLYINPILRSPRLMRSKVKNPRINPDALQAIRACTFMPNRHWITFERPLVDLKSLCMIVMDHLHDSGKLFTRIQSYQARLDRHARTLWKPSTCLQAQTFPTWQLIQTGPSRRIASSRALAWAARNLLHASLRAQDRSPRASGPLFPPTLVGLPSEVTVTPACTPLVRQVAQVRQTFWQKAWHHLQQSTQQPELEARFGYRLIDTRLLEALPTTLDEWHWMPPVLGHVYPNPVMPFHPNSPRTPQALRQQLPRLVAHGCCDADLTCAITHPDQPLVASRIACIQVWRSPAA